jgi:peptide chain release factor 2
LPTGVVVQCQNERSQHKNKETAMKILKAKLYELEEEKRRNISDKHYDNKGTIAWGNQIRSYIFCPYTLVKDHRTNFEVGNIQAVMDGEIEEFIESYLDMKKL